MGTLEKLCYIMTYTISTKCKNNIKYINTLCRGQVRIYYYFFCVCVHLIIKLTVNLDEK